MKKITKTLYEFETEDLSNIIASFVAVITIAVVFVEKCFIKELLVKIVIMSISSILMLICIYYVLFRGRLNRCMCYDEKFIEYFGEIPELISLKRNGNFTVVTKEKIYHFEHIKDYYYDVEIFEKHSFTNAKGDYYSIKIFENIDSETKKEK